MSDNQQPFLFDDYFVSDDDPGIEEVLRFGDREVPIRLNRALDLKDYSAAEKKAVKTRLNKQGQMEVVSVDEEEFAVQILYRLIKSWPFTYKNGKPVPVTPENIRKMNVQGSMQLAALVKKILAGKEEANSFFGNRSGEVS